MDPAYKELNEDVSEISLVPNIKMMLEKGQAMYPNQYKALEGWNNQLAVVRINEAVKYFRKKFGADMEPDIGRNITYFWDVPGHKGKQTYLRWEIRNWWYYHDKPGDHADFFFLWVKMKIPEAKLKNLYKISNSIVVYAVGHEVGAGCHVRAAGVATLSIVKQYVNNEITLPEAIDMYNRLVAKLVGEEMQNGIMNTPLADVYEKYLLA